MSSSAPIVLSHREAVEAVDRGQRGFLSCGPVLDDAGDLMEAMAMAAVVRSVDLTTYQGRQWWDRLAHIALEMAASRLTGTAAPAASPRPMRS